MLKNLVNALLFQVAGLLACLGQQPPWLIVALVALVVHLRWTGFRGRVAGRLVLSILVLGTRWTARCARSGCLHSMIRHH